MKIYFAGNTGVERRELILTNWLCPRLYSYHFILSNFFNTADMMEISKKNKIDLFLDSGAFSAWTQGIEINIQDYIKFIKEHKKYLNIYANLDVISVGGKKPNKETAELTLQNQKIMEKAGLNPLPCFHYGEPYSYLQYYIDNYEYVALGGMVGTGSTKLMGWLDHCFKNYICTPDGYPKVKIHGFGITSLQLMRRYPWYSVDSTSWVVTGRNGSIFVPLCRNGKYDYSVNPIKIDVSNRSPNAMTDMKTNISRDAKATHISTIQSKNLREQILMYIDEKGYQLGKSEFRYVNKNYELQSNERWAEKKNTSKKERKVEKIIEEGLCNKYELRDEMNIIYYLDLEKTFPKWPWPFLQSTTKSMF